MKTYTDIEQSEKLAEILPLDTADGYWEAQRDPTSREWGYHLFVGTEWASPEVVIPAWSLTALINTFPCGETDPIFSLTRGGGWI